MSNAKVKFHATKGVKRVRELRSVIDGRVEYEVYVVKHFVPTDRAVEDYEVWFADIVGGTARFERVTPNYMVFRVWKLTAIQQALF